jgi:glycosyltransferase involved in cell wall biosynthesis
MNVAPQVTVIMNCAYGVRFLRAAIESVFAQTFADWEILFVDNASDDGCAEMAREYEQTGKLRYFRLDKRVPIGPARNFALDNVRTEYLCFLDSDDLLAPDALQKLRDAMRDDTALVYGGWRFIGAEGNPLDRKVQGRAVGDIANALLMRAFISISCLLARRSAFDGLRFRPDYDLVGDFDMWIQMSTQGRKFDFAEGHLGLCRIHGGNESILKYRKWISEQRKFYRSFLARFGAFRYCAIFAYIAKSEISSMIGRNKVKLSFKPEKK